MQRNSGFTIIELMVIFIIIGIFAAMSVPPFLKIIRKYQVSTAAQNIANVINYAKNQAVTKTKVAYVYPALFKVDATLNGQATSWSNANGIVAFIDSNTSGHSVSQYDTDEEIRSIQISNTNSIDGQNQSPYPLTITAESFASNTTSFTPGELGLVILPNGSLKVSSNYNKPTYGNSGLMARIIVHHVNDDKVCHVVWIDSQARARNCTNKNSNSSYLQNLCTCATSVGS